MKTIGILHIADLHFGLIPDATDINLTTVTPELSLELKEKDSREIFLGKIQGLLGHENVDALAFTGDFGIGKNKDSIKPGIAFINKIRERLEIKRSHTVIALGNHDLNRKASSKKEFVYIEKLLQLEEFSYATRAQPAFIQVNDIPIIALNTCLGATEFSLNGLPVTFWDTALKSLKDFKRIIKEKEIDIPSELIPQLKAMDIPAIGTDQLSKLHEFYGSLSGNCIVVLGHHNPLPTHNIVIRPYADIIDAGRLIFNLIENGRRVIFLHGHTHCNSSLVAYSPQESRSGFIACLGVSGLHGSTPETAPSASFIKIFSEDNSNFLMAIVYRYERVGSDFRLAQNFQIKDEINSYSRVDLDISQISSRTSLYLEEYAQELNYKDQEHLAEELLKISNNQQINILDCDRPYQDWRIIKKY